MAVDDDLLAEARRNWDKHGWAAADAMAAVTSIIRAQQIVLARIDEALRPFNLTFSRFEALALLHFTRRGGLPMGKIGTRLQVHPTSVTNLVDRLERAGLVERRAHPTDRRAVIAEITQEGRRVAVAAAAALADVRFGLGGVEDDDCNAIEATLRVVRREAGDLS